MALTRAAISAVLIFIWAVVASAEPDLSVLPRSYTDAEINSCLQSVCGSASGNQSDSDALAARRNESATFTEMWTEKLAPAIQETFVLRGQNNSSLLRELPRASKTGVGDLKVFGARLALQKALIAGSTVVHPADLDHPLHQDELLHYLRTQPRNERRAIALAFQIVYKSMYAPGPDFSDGPVTARLKRLKKTLAADALDLKQKYFTLQSRIGVLEQIVSARDIGVIDSAARGAEIDRADERAYVSAAVELEVLSFALDEANSAVFEKAGEDAAALLKNAMLSQAMETMAADARIDRMKQSASTLEVCRPRLAMGLAMNSSELATRQMKTMANEVRRAAKVVATRLSLSDAGMAAVLDQMQFQFPKTSVDKSNEFSAMIAQDLEHERATRKLIAEKPAVFRQLLATEVILDSLKKQTLRDPKGQNLLPKSPTQIACENLVETVVSDYTEAQKNLVTVSWFAVTNADVGVPLIAHEVGHIVSHRIRNSTNAQQIPFMKSLTCVANRNPFVTEPSDQIEPNDNTETSEEDFADHFSALVVNELELEKSPWVRATRNLGCALVHDDGEKYSQNQMQHTPGDPHSSGLMRLLMTAVDLGQMTPQCAPLVEYAQAASRQLICQ